MQDRIWESMKRPHVSESLTRGVGRLGENVTTKQNEGWTRGLVEADAKGCADKMHRPT